MRGNQPDASMPQARCPSAEPSLFPWLRSQENAQATRGADDQKTGCHRSFFSLNRVGLERRRASARMPSRASAPQRIASLRAPKAGYWHRLLSVSRPRETERRRNAAGMVVIHGNPACGVLHVLQHTALASWLPAPARQRQLARASPRATPFAASRPRPAHACAGQEIRGSDFRKPILQIAFFAPRNTADSRFPRREKRGGRIPETLRYGARDRMAGRAAARREDAPKWPPPDRATARRDGSPGALLAPGDGGGEHAREP